MDPVPSTSNPPKPVRNPAKRKPKAPHPSNLASAPRRKVPPSLPPRPPAHPSQPHKTSQGLKTQRNDTTHPGFGREVVFVTRSTGLGLLIGRCRSLVVVEGWASALEGEGYELMHDRYTTLRLHAMSAAIPQALLLLHALMDILPYPKGEKGMWYEIRTGSVECVDEVSAGPRGDSGVEKEKEDEVMGVNWDGIGGMEDIGGMEEDEPELTVRIKSSIQIDLHTSPRPRPGQLKLKAEGEKRRNRPSKKRRGVLSRRKVGHQVEDEETMMNASGEAGAGREGMQVVPGGVVDDEEEEEEIEERASFASFHLVYTLVKPASSSHVDHGCRQDHSGGSQRWFLQTMLFTLLGRHIMSSQAVLAPVIDPTVIASLFGTSQFSLALLDFVTSLHPPSSSTIQPGKNSVFPDCTYESHPTLGLSLCFASGTSPSSSSRCLDAVDIFNPPLHPPPKSRSRRKAAWEGCSPPPLPIPFTFPSTTITVPPFKPGEEAQVIDRLAVLEVTSGTTGREFVGAFGEPSRKGGGTGWVPVFMEWRRVELIPASSRDGMNGIADSGKEEEKETVEVGIMVELGDQGAGVLTDEQRKNGLGGVWDQAARWEWETLKLFKPSSRPGKKDG